MWSSVEVPLGPQWAHANATMGALGGAPYGATKRVMGAPELVKWAHANAATEAFGGIRIGPQNTVREGCANKNALGACNRSFTVWVSGTPYGATHCMRDVLTRVFDSAMRPRCV